MIWTANGNCVAALPPAPGDLFVVATLFGERVFIKPVGEYGRAIEIAEAFARATTHLRPFTIKVLSMTFGELIAHMGHTREEYAKLLTPEDAERDRKAAVDACMNILRTSNEPQVRAEALEILKQMGAIQ
jgi:hypothetical protein